MRKIIWMAAVAAVCVLSGCRVTKPMLEWALRSTNQVSQRLEYADSCEHVVGIPYVENGDPVQVLDVYYAEGTVRKNAVLIDIHGGFYVAGRRENNRALASVFLKEGYDVVLVEYRLNDGRRDVSDELKDCAAALDYLAVNASKLRLNHARMFLTGDSAGGHLALYMAEGAENVDMPVRPALFKPRGVMLNCPAYDFASFSESKMFSKSALAWYLGPRYKDADWMSSVSPRTYISSYTGPLFLSTCTRDFIRGESLRLKSDCESLGRELVFVDIESSAKNVGHVHNVVNPSLPESRKVNSAMLSFMDGLL